MIQNYSYQPYNLYNQYNLQNNPQKVSERNSSSVGFTGHGESTDPFIYQPQKKDNKDKYLTWGIVGLGTILAAVLMFKGKDVPKALENSKNTENASKNIKNTVSESKINNTVDTGKQINSTTSNNPVNSQPANAVVNQQVAPPRVYNNKPLDPNYEKNTLAYKQYEEQKYGLSQNIKAISKAKGRTIELCEDIAKQEGNDNWLKTADDFKLNLKSDKSIYQYLFSLEYGNIRYANYSDKFRFDRTIDVLTGKDSAFARVKESNGWHYRYPLHLNGKLSTVDRISVNAAADKKLIKDLDEFMQNEKINGYYKTPEFSTQWLMRHDPVTIYLGEKATPELLSKIEKLTKPYIRSTEDVLVGQKFAPGLALEKSPKPQDIQNLINQADKIDPLLSKVFTNEMTRNGKLKASAGEVTAANRILTLLNQP